ncbi:toxin secretion/phage lysis holin [Lachnospiraceae bacterium PFB1-21]
MKKMDKIKIIVTGIMAALSSLLGVLYIPVLILVACNIIDYATGLMAAPHRHESVKSYKSIKGITKKVCMWLLVIVGALIDELLAYSIATLHITLPFAFPIACIVAIWIICNELISILENIADIGTPVPAFLKKIIMYLKDASEDKADIIEDKENDNAEL